MRRIPGAPSRATALEQTLARHASTLSQRTATIGNQRDEMDHFPGRKQGSVPACAGLCEARRARARIGRETPRHGGASAQFHTIPQAS